MSKLLACTDLVIGYDLPLVGGLNFSVRSGQMTLVYGPNGAGKTTLLRTLMGLVQPIEGQVDWSLPGRPAVPRDLVRAGVRYLGQGPRGFDRLPVREQTSCLTRLYGMPARSPLVTVGLNRSVGSLSYGQRRLAALSALQAGEPRLYLLDEPFAGIDFEQVERVSAWCASELARGAAFLVVEHRIAALRRQVDWVVEIQGRSMHFSGPPDLPSSPLFTPPELE